MKPIYWIISGVIVLGLAGYVGMDYLTGRTSTPETLAEQALSSSDASERLKAVAHLMGAKDPARALPCLLRVANESKDPYVQSAALHGLRSYVYEEGVLFVLIDSLNHHETLVRETAHDNLLNFYGGRLPAGLKYDVDDPPAQRLQVMRRLRENATAVHVTPDKLDKKTNAAPDKLDKKT